MPLQLRGLLHKLAGSAGMFEKAELETKAADPEDALELCPRERPARVRETIEALTEAT
ncbi:Hpt domain-containing protein [Sphingomonas sp. Root241]|uniref:Hpt domain-containing protein n=1 Tax=Sphingomonas sp. Root241 TaxID=1736501 RepID=UPI000A8E3422|nr:Hpt domain-containing protein [Sphingomonas sp. Root241]